jgi:hypothetical protein
MVTSVWPSAELIERSEDAASSVYQWAVLKLPVTRIVIAVAGELE